MPNASHRPDLFAGPPISARTSFQAPAAGGARQAAPHKHARRDIQGLRALAVTAVFINHVSGHPRGAFVGVDVFFVVSGFLITGLLVRDAQRPNMTVGGFFSGFYQRRVRRILPAAVVVLLLSWLAAALTFSGSRLAQTRIDFLWSLGFLANVHFAEVGTDYFQSSRPPSIYQHFWSLAVEEQFYVVWPVVIVIVLMLLRRRRRGSLTSLLGIVAALTAASFVYALHDSAASPTTAYFSTFARAWELGVGALLAVLAARFPRLFARFGRWAGPAAVVGLAGIVTSFFVVSPDSGFPAPSGALPVLATALVIAAGAENSRWSVALSNPVSQYVGDISYSLYLWHWPTIIIASALMPQRNALYYLVVVTAALALSVASFEFIETPARTRRWRTEDVASGRRSTSSALLAAVLAVVAVTGFAFRPDPVAPDFLAQPVSGQTGLTSQTPIVLADLAAAPTGLTKAIRNALGATSWPETTPSTDDPESGTAPQMLGPSNCLNNYSRSITPCTYGAGQKVAVVVGDSVAASWMPGLVQALTPVGYRVHAVTFSNCAFTAAKVVLTFDPAAAQRCNEHRADQVAQIEQLHPDLLIMSSASPSLNEVSGGTSTTVWRRGMEQIIERVRPYARRIVTLGEPPEGDVIGTCKTTSAPPAACVSPVSDLWRAKRDASESAARNTRSRYVDTSPWFCSNSYCPIFVGSTLVRWDSRHLTKQYSESLAPELRSVLLPH